MRNPLFRLRLLPSRVEQGAGRVIRGPLSPWVLRAPAGSAAAAATRISACWSRADGARRFVDHLRDDRLRLVILPPRSSIVTTTVSFSASANSAGRLLAQRPPGLPVSRCLLST